LVDIKAEKKNNFTKNTLYRPETQPLGRALLRLFSVPT
jgi:hypothetical protein